jgi:Pentapeptide repeats (8 copies)
LECGHQNWETILRFRAWGTRSKVLAWVVLAACVSVLVIGVLPTLILELDIRPRSDELSPLELAQAKNDIRTTVLQTLAGLGIVAGAVATWRTLGVNREGQITERFTRAIDQLGSDKLDIRVGGIYALERIARDSKEDHGPIIEILTAFVRQNAPWSSDSSPDDEEVAWGAIPAHSKADIQAALTVVARRDVSRDPPDYRLNLSSADLRKANLGNARLDRASFRYSSLENAYFRGAYLRHADFFFAHLEDADFTESVLEGADLFEAITSGTRLVDSDVSNVDFSLIDLSGLDLVGAKADDRTTWPEGFDPAAVGVITTPTKNPTRDATVTDE